MHRLTLIIFLALAGLFAAASLSRDALQQISFRFLAVALIIIGERALGKIRGKGVSSDPAGVLTKAPPFLQWQEKE